jgi:hypothetical protein
MSGQVTVFKVEKKDAPDKSAVQKPEVKEPREDVKNEKDRK